MTTNTTFEIKRDGKLIALCATEAAAMAFMHRTTSCSIDHATKHEGYSIKSREGDAVYARDIALFAANDGGLYRQQTLPIVANLQRKLAKHQFNAERANVLWNHLANTAAKKYAKEFGGGVVDVPTRYLVALELAEQYDEHVREDS